MRGEGDFRLMGGIIVTEDQGTLGILEVIGIGQLFQAVTCVDILGEKKAGAIRKADETLYYADFWRPGICVQFRSDNQIRKGKAADYPSQLSLILTKKHTGCF